MLIFPSASLYKGLRDFSGGVGGRAGAFATEAIECKAPVDTDFATGL